MCKYCRFQLIAYSWTNLLASVTDKKIRKSRKKTNMLCQCCGAGSSQSFYAWNRGQNFPISPKKIYKLWQNSSKIFSFPLKYFICLGRKKLPLLAACFEAYTIYSSRFYHFFGSSCQEKKKERKWGRTKDELTWTVVHRNCKICIATGSGASDRKQHGSATLDYSTYSYSNFYSTICWRKKLWDS